MTFEYNATVEDLLAFQYYEIYGEERGQAQLRGVVYGVVTAMLGGAVVYAQTRRLSLALGVGAVVGIFFMVVWPSVERYRIRNTVLRMYRGHADPALGAQRLELGPTELRVTGGGILSIVPWDVIQKVAFTSTHCFILLGPYKAIAIPRAGLGDAAREFESALPVDKIEGVWFAAP